jgi:hypothetical protein
MKFLIGTILITVIWALLKLVIVNGATK